jgi:hypothetical protein
VILQFPKNGLLLEKNGFEGIKIDKDLAARIRGSVSELQYNEVSNLNGDKLYSVGTHMAIRYDQKKLVEINDLGKEIVARSADLYDIDAKDIEINYFISKCTKGYHVPWHSDCKDDKSFLSVPLYFLDGQSDYESGMLEFAYSQEVEKGNPTVLNSMPARHGYGALILSKNSTYSHQVKEIKKEKLIRYMVRYELRLI